MLFYMSSSNEALKLVFTEPPPIAMNVKLIFVSSIGAIVVEVVVVVVVVEAVELGFLRSGGRYGECLKSLS